AGVWLPAGREGHLAWRHAVSYRRNPWRAAPQRSRRRRPKVRLPRADRGPCVAPFVNIPISESISTSTNFRRRLRGSLRYFSNAVRRATRTFALAAAAPALPRFDWSRYSTNALASSGVSSTNKLTFGSRVVVSSARELPKLTRMPDLHAVAVELHLMRPERFGAHQKKGRLDVLRGALVVARGPEGTRGWRVVEPSAMGEVKADGALTLPARQLGCVCPTAQIRPAANCVQRTR